MNLFSEFSVTHFVEHYSLHFLRAITITTVNMVKYYRENMVEAYEMAELMNIIIVLIKWICKKKKFCSKTAFYILLKIGQNRLIASLFATLALPHSNDVSKFQLI